MSENKDKIKSNSIPVYFLIILVVLLTVTFGISCYMLDKYDNNTKNIMQTYHQGTTTYFNDIIKLIKGDNATTEIVADMKDAQEQSYQDFMKDYYTVQSEWLNRWLTILGMLLAFIGIMTPLVFVKYYSEKKQELEKLEDKLCDMLKDTGEYQKEVRATHVKMEKSVGDVEEYKFNIENDIKAQQEQMKNDIKEVKEYVEEAKEAEKQAKISQLLSEASVFFSQRKYNESVMCSEKILEIAPNYKEAYLGLGVNYIKLKQYDDAINSYERVLAMDPVNKIAYLNCAYCHTKKEDYEKAIEIYSKIIDINANNVTAYENIGICYAKQGQYDDAIKYYNMALQIDNTNQYTLYNRIEAYIFKKDFKKALSSLKKYTMIYNSIPKDAKFKLLDFLNGLSYNDDYEIKEIINIIEELIELIDMGKYETRI